MKHFSFYFVVMCKKPVFQIALYSQSIEVITPLIHCILQLSFENILSRISSDRQSTRHGMLSRLSLGNILYSYEEYITVFIN